MLFVASTISGELNLVFYLLSYANKNLQGSNKRKRKHLQSRNNVKDSPEVSAGIHPVPGCQMLEAESLERAHASDHVLMGCSLETKTQPVFDVNIYLPVAIMQCNAIRSLMNKQQSRKQFAKEHRGRPGAAGTGPARLPHGILSGQDSLPLRLQGYLFS